MTKSKKGKTPAQRRGPTTDKPAPPSDKPSKNKWERLSLLFYLVFRCSPHPAYQEQTIRLPDGSEETNVPRWNQAIKDAKIPPFWETDQAPPEYQTMWGRYWSEICAAWSQDAMPEGCPINVVTAFDWSQNEGLRTVASVNSDKGWDRVLDDLVRSNSKSVTISRTHTALVPPGAQRDGSHCP